MASWRELLLASLVYAAAVAGVMAADSFPAERIENAPSPGSRSGFIAPAVGGAVTWVAMEAAIRADAARAWQLADSTTLQVSAEDVTWGDGSLGCPRPGMAYTQALVPGWRVVVRVAGRDVVYHASRRGQWLLCPMGRAAPPAPGAVTR